MRPLLLGFGWLGGYYLLAQYGVYLLPRAVAATTTLPQYVAMVQIVSILLGMTLVLRATNGERNVRGHFFPELVPGHRPMASRLVSAFLFGPAVFLAAYGLAMYLAFDTLLQELAERGARAVQAQTGELGRAALADTLWTILPFTVILAPLGEELLFRGGVYGAVQAVVEKRYSKPSAQEAPPSSLAVAGLPKKRGGAGTKVHSWLIDGGAAVIVSSFCFGIMHADTEGGMGIVRVVSASFLGLSCGLSRRSTKTLLAPIVLHAAFNLVSLASVRGWLVSEAFPTKYTIPTALVPLSLITLTAAGALHLARRHRAASERD